MNEVQTLSLDSSVKQRYIACKKGWQKEGESTIASSKVEDKLKSLFDFDDSFGVANTLV